MITKLQPDIDILQDTSIWSFPDRGSWATHNSQYRGNWSPYIPRNIIKRYSKVGDTILDVFCGSGTTLVEAKLLGRNAIGVDINPQAISIAERNLDFENEQQGKIEVRRADAKDIYFIENNSIDLVCTHPPYSNIIQYSSDIEGDLSLQDIGDFLLSLEVVSRELYRVLKPGKYCAFLIGDLRRKGNVIPLGFQCMNVFEKSGFTLKEIVIKQQHNCHSTSKWVDNAKKYNFLLLAHEYLFVLKK